MKRTNKKGFTIVELVIVIAVIAVLAAVLVPTFGNLINKANISVDEQLVNQLNKILAAEEIGTNAPLQAAEVQKILKANGIKNVSANLSQNVIYWVGSDNRVLLWTTNDDGTGKVTYPEDLATKYASYTKPSVDWDVLNDTTYVEKEVVVEEGSTIENALIGAVASAGVADSVVLSMPSNSEVTLSASQISEFNNSLSTDDNVGKSVTIDLNGSTLNAERESVIYNIPTGGNLEIANGTMNITSTNYSHAGFQIQEGASLVLRNMDITAVSYATFFPVDTASEVIIDNCNITLDAYYGLMTNGMTSSNVKVVIKNSYFKADASHGILVNCPANVYIENSHIIASKAAVTMRAGSAEIINSKLEVVSETAGIYFWKEFIHNSAEYGFWKTGNAMPAGCLVLGDHSKSSDDSNSQNTFSYAGDISCSVSGVEFITKNAAELPKILIGSRAYKNVSLTSTMDNIESIIQLYNWPHPAGHGTVTVNGVEQTFTDDRT